MTQTNGTCRVFGQDCKNSTHEECDSLFFQYAKVVFCKDANCFWNKQLHQQVKYVRTTNTSQPFPGDGYEGICTRPELGLTSTQVHEANSKRQVATCAVRSDNKTGHIDFTQFPQGGTYPEPVAPDTAFV